MNSFVVRLFSKSTAFRCYVYAIILPLQIKSFLAPNQETLSLGTDLRYFDETLVTSLLPAGSLFMRNRIGLCPLFSVGWGWEASKGYAEPSTPMPDHLPTKRTLIWHQRKRTFAIFVLLHWAERWRAIFGSNIASWLISHLTVTAINGDQYSPTLHIPPEAIWRNCPIIQNWKTFFY